MSALEMTFVLGLVAWCFYWIIRDDQRTRRQGRRKGESLVDFHVRSALDVGNDHDGGQA